MTTKLVGDSVDGDDSKKWSTFVDGKDGFFYGIPCDANRVVKFNPLDRTMTEIGPDLGDEEWKWNGGVRANNSNIYCAPCNCDEILKIDTIRETVETISDAQGQLDRGDISRKDMWMSGVLAKDNLIYFMPCGASQILRLNPKDDTFSKIGYDFGDQWGKYYGTVLGNDDCIYGIPFFSNRIVKFDPNCPENVSFVGAEAKKSSFHCGNGVLADDGHIYALNDYGQVLKVDTASNNCTLIGEKVQSFGRRWGNPVIGIDRCIYWPPSRSNRVLKFDPETQESPSHVGGDLGGEFYKWVGAGVVASDGLIYCVPLRSNYILVIDPFQDLTLTWKKNMKEHPDKLGNLFVKGKLSGETLYERSIRNFGYDKISRLVEETFPIDEQWAAITQNTNLPLFTYAASYENSALPIVNFLLRRNVNALLENMMIPTCTNILCEK